ncbi:MAG: hypothetical protein ABJA87_12715 [bacterium]
MTDHSLRRADELLTELVEMVETARTVPISGSCIVPREHTLDLLDDLRDVLPPEMARARVIVAEADGRLADAERRASELQARSEAEAQGRLEAAAATVREHLDAATEHAAQLVADARAEAARIVDEAQAENARLLSSAGVHQAATAAAAQVRADADAYSAQVREAADEEAALSRREAVDYATFLRTNADDYAERTLAEIVAVLHRSATTAERGRAELAARRGAPAAPPEADAGTASAM